MTDAADLVLLGGTIERMTAEGPPADAVALRDGLIIGVGSHADLRPLVGARTEVVELAGETVLPGFGDAHIHPIEAGMLADRCDLRECADASAVLDTVHRYATAHPERPWIIGAGWSLDQFEGGAPDRELLDRLVGDRPAFLESNDGHVAWVSSAALRIAGVTASTGEPADGRILRRADGEPCGALVDGAVALVARHVPPTTNEERLGGLRNALRELHGYGITQWQDAHVEAADLAAYREADENGWLTARVEAALWWDRRRGLEQIDELEQLRRSVRPGGRLRANSVKLMLDGIVESRTAWMTGPYHGTDDDRGAPFIDPALLREAVAELDRRGFQAHFHAIGDAAVRLALDAVDEARRRNGPSDHRHHVSHLEVVDPVDLSRFAELGVVANIQPFWAVDDEQMQALRIPALGASRVGWQFTFEGMRRAGARLAGGSDWPVTTADPLLEVEVATTRVPTTARDAPPFLPDERIRLDDALRAFTAGTAFVNHLDAETGTIEVGKRADLVVLDRNLRAPDAGPIGDARVRCTLVDGSPVHGTLGAAG
jgi:predicted amidohydrolase YtcJ